jgi:hypothetical protein
LANGVSIDVAEEPTRLFPILVLQIIRYLAQDAGDLDYTAFAIVERGVLGFDSEGEHGLETSLGLIGAAVTLVAERNIFGGECVGPLTGWARQVAGVLFA